MSTQRFTPEFKEEAVKQVTECGYSPQAFGTRATVPVANSGWNMLERHFNTAVLASLAAQALVTAQPPKP